MRIDVSELLKKVGSESKIETELKVSYPEDGIELVKPVKLKVKLVNTGEEILLTGTLSTAAKMECSRCLGPSVSKVDAELEEHFRTEVGERVAKDLELEPDDFVFPLEGGHFVPIDEVVRQVIITALPTQPICSQNCKGLKEEE